MRARVRTSVLAPPTRFLKPNKFPHRRLKDMRSRTQERKRPPSLANLGINHVGLKVANVQKSLGFYQEILGLKGRASKREVAHVPSGGDILVLHEKGYGLSNFHFGFRLDSPSKVYRWRAWLRSRNIRIYQEVTEEKYRSIKVRDPDGYRVEISYDGRGTLPRPQSLPRKPKSR